MTDPLQDLKEQQIQYHEATSKELAETFREQTKSALEAGKLSQDSLDQLQQMPLETLDELERAYTSYVDMLSRPEYYKLLERIVRGAAYIERVDITEAQREKARKLYDSLCEELEAMKDGAK